jgi:hypothetical protein
MTLVGDRPPILVIAVSNPAGATTRCDLLAERLATACVPGVESCRSSVAGQYALDLEETRSRVRRREL